MFIRQALTYGKDFLDNSETAFLDTIVVLKKITGLTKEKILIDSDNNKLDTKQTRIFFDMLNKRKKHMPVQYIVNHAEFMGLDFYVDQNVLIPRPDTEILVEQVLIYIKKVIDYQDKIKILDLCTGSGCIAIAIKKFYPDVFVTALDISPAAINIASKNANSNQVDIKFICGDIFKRFDRNLAKDFDIIISNPPYIKSDHVQNLAESVRNYEPRLALDGGCDGIRFYDFIINNITYVKKIFFEIGSDQSETIKKILERSGFIGINIIKDLAGLDRVISAQKNS